MSGELGDASSGQFWICTVLCQISSCRANGHPKYSLFLPVALKGPRCFDRDSDSNSVRGLGCMPSHFGWCFSLNISHWMTGTLRDWIVNKELPLRCSLMLVCENLILEIQGVKENLLVKQHNWSREESAHYVRIFWGRRKTWEEGVSQLNCLFFPV